VRVVVIRHHDVDSAGFIGEAFAARGADLSTYLFPDEGPLPSLEDAGHVVMLGASYSVNDDRPSIAAELEWLRAADRRGVPVLGICFGAQALCVALGGRVERAPRQEIGWMTVDTADPALVAAGPWLEFHGDRCLIPPTATELASTEVGVQAFRVGRHLGVQFHPEVDGAQLKRWLDSGADADAAKIGVDPAEFLQQTIRAEPSARTRADRLVEAALSLRSPSSG
jgi:GMP synthase-like glutamine amidotransferase